MIFLTHADPARPHIDNLSRHLDALGQSLELALAKAPEPFWGMHTPDWIQAGLLVVAVLALFYTGRTLRETARGRDVENYLKFTDLISAAWRRYGSAAAADKRFEFLELMNLLEAACHMYNKEIIGGTTREAIKDYLMDILPKIFADATASGIITSAQTAPATYVQIRYFAHSLNLQGVPQSIPPKGALWRW